MTWAAVLDRTPDRGDEDVEGNPAFAWRQGVMYYMESLINHVLQLEERLPMDAKEGLAADLLDLIEKHEPKADTDAA